MDDITTIERRPNVAIDTAVLFSMRNLALLEQGTTYDPLATAENLWMSIKVYDSAARTRCMPTAARIRRSSCCKARPLSRLVTGEMPS